MMFIEQLLQLGAVFGMGLYIATSPCIFPLLPLFLIRNLQSEESRRKSVVVTMILAAGILASLAIFIAISAAVGLLIIRYYETIQGILGVILIFLGLLTMSQKLRDKLGVSRLKMRDPGDPKGLFGVFTVGFGYSLLAAPCTGPVILALPTFISMAPDLFMVILMFFVLCIGVIIPYLIIALATGEARNRAASRMAASAHKIEILVGIMLVGFGIYFAWPWFLSFVTS